ncbi:ABC transporter ATP-binding protein [Castellaniella sp.]|uniref:ABC transporter ATP-binding protein n=1 Tax=Castellaniella sp. TaxID=1955812 RepID=UPI003C78AA6E
MATLSIRSLSKSYGAARVVDDISLDIADSEFIALLGPSGCGKTTLLRMIAGFVPVTGGQILIDGRDVTHTPPHLRNTGMVFQSYALFPHMTVAENVAFGLKMRGVSKEESLKRSADALSLVQLQEYAKRYPRELSGGQQQRVAIARVLVIRPDAFLLDEPLSNLDAKLRQSVGLEIRALQRKLGLTTVFVTHDQNEALGLADRLVLMNGGKVVQSGSAIDLYNNPADSFVANFLGRANLLAGSVSASGSFTTDDGLVVACDTKKFAPGSQATLCVRPENIHLGPAAAEQPNTVLGRVAMATYLGSVTEVEVRIPRSETSLTIHIQNRKDDARPVLPEVDQEYVIGWNRSSALLLSPK